ncbi:MAG: phosphate/phosphite/phosphonate ABC transporter substrate-binding protein [Okeania sp. SIO3I5]|uniref:phosphate/phosphite/phosphonate ABC transporter substrate-binding protein n=1 Tax=Okeania sp. SIO3I5 TaxID=2607805 RepID=UPI0013BD31F3|nr:phosphate/phosphite/phosphonate ABC transporter substrate-binding protein [Okeania sp. SIO3I5]NEQ41686.1 phosphate/phosphite/phosphonate ABC transporter substrate-binding protein [Okeania sp. SIO3I5]
MKRRNFIGYTLLFITSCSATTNNTNNWEIENKPEILRLAVTDVVEAGKLERDYEAFRAALEAVLATKIEFFPVDSFAMAAAALQLNQVDLLLAGPSEYVVINARTNAIPLIGVTRPNYRSVIAVPAGSPIKSAAQLQGKTLALSDIGSTSGHLGPTKLLMEAGLDPKSDLKILMLGDDGSLENFKQGKVDAWGGSAVDYEYLLETEGASKNDFPIVAKTDLLPSDVIIVSHKLDSQVVEEYKNLIVNNQDKLITALAKGESTKKYQGSKLVAANDSDYDLIRDVYQAIGEGDLIAP